MTSPWYETLGVFDLETTGVDVETSRIVSAHVGVIDGSGEVVERRDWLADPGIEIPEQASAVHGITTERALAEGRDLEKVLQEFHAEISSSEILVGHNIGFDVKVVGAEFIRLNFPPIVPERRKICTMLSSTKYCNLPGRCGPKWPKLQELHNKLFSENFAEAHNAAADINATAKCFFELKRIGVIEA